MDSFFPVLYFISEFENNTFEYFCCKEQNYSCEGRRGKKKKKALEVMYPARHAVSAIHSRQHLMKRYETWYIDKIYLSFRQNVTSLGISCRGFS